MPDATAPVLAAPVLPWPTRRAWWWIALLGALLIAYFRAWLWRMGLIATSQWGGDWSHAPLIPLLAIWIVAQRRGELAQVAIRPCWPAAGVLVAGLASYAFWIYPGRNDMFQGYSFVLSVLGLVWFVLGTAMMRRLLAPVLYLALAVKVSDRLWDQLAWPLQLLAARCATVVLNMVGLFNGMEATVRGSTIEITALRDGAWISRALTVAEACSGLRMLAAFVALGAAVALLTSRAAWQRVVLLLLTVPVAVAVNVGRVTVLGLLALIDAKLTEGDFHQFIGLLMLVPALGLFVLAGWVLDRVVIYEPEGEAGGPGATAAPAQPDAGTARAALVAAILLALAALGLNTALRATRTVLIKAPLPLRQPLYLLPREMGRWQMTQEDPPLGPDMVEALGTRHYLSRTYRDTSRPADEPGNAVRLHVAYYTGTPDTVPHVPDRCFVAAGATPVSRQRVTLTVNGEPVSATAFTYRRDADDPRTDQAIYFFSANGKLLATPEQVRLQGFALTDRHAYYCKVEIGLNGISDLEQAGARASAFLDDCLPALLVCLPDWADVKNGSPR
jgi:exosortase